MEQMATDSLLSPKYFNSLIEEIAKILTEKKLKLVTAESCTGGWISQSLTAVAGSSDWFECGFVTYSNRSKQHLLGVKPHTLAAFGAVSKQVVTEMAEGALKSSFAEISLAITGIAGPTGGTVQKPVGTCWFAWQSEFFTKSEQQIFLGDRTEIRWQAVVYALSELKNLLTKV